MRKLIISLTVIAVVAYGGVLAFIMASERTLVFQAARARGPLRTPDAALHLPYERVEFVSGDGTKLVGWQISGAMPDSNGLWVLVNHGNGHNLSQLEEPEFLRDLRGLGVNIFIYDYRGFGESAGEADELGAYADARAAYDLLRTKYGVSAERMIVYGHSLGTGVAVHLASTAAVGALVLQAPYTSIPDLGARRYPYLPIRSLATFRFSSLERMPKVTAPLLILHSPQDAVIPLAMAEQLQLAAGSKDRRFIHVEGGHELAFRTDSAIFFRAFREMVNRVAARADSIERLQPGDPGRPRRVAPEPTGGRRRG